MGASEGLASERLGSDGSERMAGQAEVSEVEAPFERVIRFIVPVLQSINHDRNILRPRQKIRR